MPYIINTNDYNVYYSRQLAPGSEEGAVESDPGGEEDRVDHRTNLTASSDLTAVAALARVESGVKSTPWERRKTWRE